MYTQVGRELCEFIALVAVALDGMRTTHRGFARTCKIRRSEHLVNRCDPQHISMELLICNQCWWVVVGGGERGGRWMAGWPWVLGGKIKAASIMYWEDEYKASRTHRRPIIYVYMYIYIYIYIYMYI